MLKFLLYIPTIIRYLKTLFAGSLIGIANLIPGVSGGTVAVMLGLYTDIIHSLRNLLSSRSAFISGMSLLLPLGLGALITVKLGSSILLQLIELREKELSFLFIGLIIGSIPSVFQLAAHKRSTPPSVNPKLAGLITFSLLALLSFFPSEGLQSELPAWGSSWWYMLLSGFVAASSMILPGLSGSLILIIMGSYSSILMGISSVSIAILAPFCLGILLGFLMMIRFISWCLNTQRLISVWAIVGLLCGSILPLWHTIPLTFTGFKYLMFIFIGYIFAYRLNELSKRNV